MGVEHSEKAVGEAPDKEQRGDCCGVLIENVVRETLRMKKTAPYLTHLAPKTAALSSERLWLHYCQ